MKPITHTTPRIAAFGLCLLAACAPATQRVGPGGGLAGPADEAAVLGLWAYEVSGSCFLFQGDLIITRDRSGLTARLTERPAPTDLRDRQRCAGRRTAPATIVMDEVTYDGEMLVFTGASRSGFTHPFRVHGRVTVQHDTLTGSLAIEGSSGNILRNEAAGMTATRADQGRQQPLTRFL